MIQHFDLMIPGAKSNDGKIEIKAPYDNSVIATVTTADKSAKDLALQTAHGLFRDRSNWLKPAKRMEIFLKAAEIMKGRAEELAVEAAREGGKPLLDSRVEVARAIDGVKGCVEVLRTQHGVEIPMGLNPASEGRLAVTRRQPIGIVAAVSAFNHPLNLIIHQAGPALMVGCPVIIKPASDTPLSCLRFVSILIEAGLPPEWCQVLIVKNRAIATEMVTDSRIAFLSFIGSADVGWKLRSQLTPGARCALEHGGVAPVIVTAKADLDLAVPPLLKGGFYHAGQVCVSVQKIFAHESIARELAERLSEGAKKLKVGDPTLAETDIGPIIRKAELERVEHWVEEAISQGTVVLAGGKRISDSCFECTVLYNPPEDSKVSQQEIFGPVICIYPYSDVSQAVAQANSLDFAFQAAVFTTDLDEAMDLYSRLDASAVMINDHTAFRVDWMPFAGLKKAGLGIGGIPHTMKDMQTEKLLVIKSKGL